MRRHVLPMFAANIVAFSSIGVSYLLYSRLLSAKQFGAYAAALAVGNLAVLALDGGIRTSVIKHRTELSPQDESSLLLLMSGFSLVLLLMLYAGQSTLTHFYPAARQQSTFVSSFAGVYLLTYPWIGLATASLERRLEYRSLAWIESAAIVIERGAPALFLLSSRLGLGSFVLGLLLGRVGRLLLLRRLHRIIWTWEIRGQMATIRALLWEGASFQIGAAASLVRDNAHVVILGPLFGAEWVGYYAWTFQLSMIASQAFVQIAARVSLPITAQTATFESRWPAITLQVALLTAATTPILALLLLLAPELNHHLFADKWLAALWLLPFICTRMIPGIACTPIGTLLLVERGSAKYASALWAWTIFEVACAFAAVKFYGPKGMAVSFCFTAWAGLLSLIVGFKKSTIHLFIEVASNILRRPATWAFFSIAGVFTANEALHQPPLPAPLVGCGLLLTVATFLVDPVIRSSLRAR